jgi:putative glutamine amidotransferase
LFEKEMISGALGQDLPLLTICAGMQVMAGILGCKLTNNVGKYFNGDVNHFDGNLMHEVVVEKDSLFFDIVGKEFILTNTHHNEGVVKLTDDVIGVGKSEDGCIEAIENRGKKFALGFQWHPENLCSSLWQISDDNVHLRIFKKFIEKCS